MKLCQIYRVASSYRATIYKKLDDVFGSDWCFGKMDTNLKEMDTSILKGNVEMVNIIHIGKFKYQLHTLKYLFRDYDTYILLGSMYNLNVWLFSIMARLFFPSKRVFFWTHGWYGRESMLNMALKKIFFHLPKGGLFLYGNYAKNLMIRQGFNPNKLFVIHNSLDYDNQLAIRNTLEVSDVFHDHWGNDNPVLLFVGRLTKVKKLDMILDAMDICRQRGKNFNLLLIGDGVQREFLEQRTMELNLTNQVWFYGECYDDTKNGELIYNSDICVSPGNIGLSAMHVLMFGTPVITHDDFTHQVPEFEAIQEGVTGMFYKYGNINSLADTIVKWIEEKSDDRELVRKSCYEVIEKQWSPQYQIEVFKKGLLID